MIRRKYGKVPDQRFAKVAVRIDHAQSMASGDVLLNENP